MRLGIEHSSGQTTRSQEETSTDANNHGRPNGKERSDHKLSLLSSVGEVVVSGAHVPEGSSLVHSDESSVEVGRSSVELHAVAGIRLDGVLVVVVLLLQISKREAICLSQHAHPCSELRGLKERSVLGEPSISGGDRGIKVRDLDHVASIGSLSSFSCISSWVSIASSPLEVDIISSTSDKESGDEVIFGGRVSLHDVSSLSSDVQVEDSLKRRDSSGSGSNVEHVGPVLEGSSELRSIDGERNVVTILSDVGILAHRGVGTVVGPINESGIGSVSVTSKIVGGNVVSDSQYAVAVIVLDALLVLCRGESPVERSLESINAVTQVVVSGPDSGDASGSGNIPGRNFNPLVSGSKASGLIVFSGLSVVLGGISAVESGLDVLRFLLVEVAPGGVHGQDSNVPPGGWGPVGIVVSLFGALKSVSISVVVLSGVNSLVSVQVSYFLSVGNKESLVSLSGVASIVVVSVLVHSVEKDSVGISGRNTVSIVRNSISGGSITNSGGSRIIGVRAHVLDNQVAVHLGVLSATVLHGPLNS